MVCRICKVDKALNDFYPYRLTVCKRCVIAKVAADHRKRKEKDPKGVYLAKRDSQLRYRFGINNADFEFLLEAQGDCCAICEAPEAGGNGTWHIDHNHETGQVRGLLCWTCNKNLGVLESKWRSLAENYLANPPAPIVLA